MLTILVVYWDPCSLLSVSLVAALLVPLVLSSASPLMSWDSFQVSIGYLFNKVGEVGWFIKHVERGSITKTPHDPCFDWWLSASGLGLWLLLPEFAPGFDSVDTTLLDWRIVDPWSCGP